jgi:hypothetical protein
MNRLCSGLDAAGSVGLWLGAQAATCGSGAADADAIVMARHSACVAHDLDAFAACQAVGVVITDLTGKRPSIVGLAALLNAYGNLFKRMLAGFQSEYLGKLVNGSLVVLSKRSVGRRNGATPSGVAMFEVRRRKIIGVWFGPFE